MDLAKDRSSATLARIDVDNDHSVGFSLRGANPARGQAQVTKNRVTYGDVQPDVDVDLTVLPAGLKEDIVLASTAAPNRYVFELALEGLTARLNDAGDVVYTDAAGAKRAVTPHGFMTDATWREGTRKGARSEAVTYELAQVSGKTLLTVIADRTWLNDPARVYPVRVDPTLFVSTDLENDTYIWFGTSYPAADRAYEWELNVGSPDGSNYARAYMSFEVAQLNGKTIDSATFRIFQRYANSCASRSLSLHRVTQSWEGHTMTGPPGASFADNLGSVSMSCDNNWRDWNITGTVRNWSSGAWGHFGLMLRADNEPDPATLRQFNSWNRSGCDCDIPHIDIYWTNPPSMASPIAPANGANFHTLTPTLSVSASDPDGDQVQYYYRVARYVGPGNGDNAETNVVYNSGWTTASSLAVPAGVLAWNASYTWHVYTWDGIAVTSPNWVWWFAPVNNAPSTPTLAQPVEGAVSAVTNPTLVATSSDPDGDAVNLAFKVSSDAGLVGNLVESGFGSGTWTIPAGALQDGRTYYWSAAARDSIGATSAWAPPRSFRVDLRLGMRPSTPFDTLGPISVNLANGNVVTGLSSPPVAGVGGPLGVSYAYNSFGARSLGLSGSYFNDDANRIFDEPASLTRTDPSVNFDWGAGSPNPAVAPDGFLVRWTGYLNAPAGTYTFGTVSDDGVRVWVNNTLVVDRWFDQGASATPIYGAPVTLSSGVAVPIKVEYYEASGAASVAVWQNGPAGATPLPSAWLSTDPPALPDGWSMSADAGGDLAYTEARVGNNEAILVDDSGAISRYTWTGTGWKPPADEDAVVTNDAARGLLVVHADDGRTYAFTHDGRLDSVTSALDPRQPAAPIYSWSGTPLRLSTITDPVSTRSIALSYGGSSSCPTAAGFSPAPANLLCKVDLSAFGAGAQELYYLNTHLARVVDPAGAIVDFGYDSLGRLTQVRDVLTNDLIAAGRIPDAGADAHKTTVAYDAASGRASSVTAPQPEAGGVRPAHSYDYGAALAKVHVAGLPEPNGYARQVTLDAVGRTASDRNAAGEASFYTWDDGDRLLRRTDPALRVTTTIYDHAGRPTDTYGPGLASEFGTDHRSSTAPRATTAYDESMVGLGATYWSNKSLSGAPVGFALGVGDPNGALSHDWGTGAPTSVPAANAGDAWSARFNGEIILPAAGTYAFRLSSNDGVRLFIDDARVLDAWYDHSGLSPAGTFVNPAAGSRHRIRVEYYDNTGASSVELQWTPPGAGTFSVVPGSNLSPRYGLSTSSVDADAKKVATEYASPALGLATATVVDPAGLALRSTTTYEPAGTGYFRRTERRLPKGAATAVAYAYFGPTETADDPCTAAVEGPIRRGRSRRRPPRTPTGAGRNCPSSASTATTVPVGGWLPGWWATRHGPAPPTTPGAGSSPSGTGRARPRPTTTPSPRSWSPPSPTRPAPPARRPPRRTGWAGRRPTPTRWPPPPAGSTTRPGG